MSAEGIASRIRRRPTRGFIHASVPGWYGPCAALPRRHDEHARCPAAVRKTPLNHQRPRTPTTRARPAHGQSKEITWRKSGLPGTLSSRDNPQASVCARACTFSSPPSAHFLLVLQWHDHRACRQGQQRLEKRVLIGVENPARAVRPTTPSHRHVSELESVEYAPPPALMSLATMPRGP